MRRGVSNHWSRIVIIAIVALGLIPFSTGNQASAQSGNGTAQLTIHYRSCSPGVLQADSYLYCHDNGVANQPLEIARRGGEPATVATDGQGNVSLDVDPGRYEVRTGVSRDWVDSVYLFCSSIDQPGVKLPEPLVLGAGDGVVCDFYVVWDSGAAVTDYGSATIDIHLRSCPAGYEGTAYFADCHDNPVPGATLSYYASADGFRYDLVSVTTDLVGNATIPYSPNDSIRIKLDSVDSVRDVAVYCSRDGGDSNVPVTVDRQLAAVEFSVEQDDAIVCDWFLLPLANDASTGSLTVHLRSCPVTTPSDRTRYYDLCHDHGLGRIDLNVWQGESRAALGSTDSTGNAAFTLPPGQYDLTTSIPGHGLRDVYTFCSSTDNSGVSVGYPVDLASSDDIVCDIYIVPADLRG